MTHWEIDSDGEIEIYDTEGCCIMWLDRETLEEMLEAVMKFEQGE